MVVDVVESVLFMQADEADVIKRWRRNVSVWARAHFNGFRPKPGPQQPRRQVASIRLHP